MYVQVFSTVSSEIPAWIAWLHRSVGHIGIIKCRDTLIIKFTADLTQLENRKMSVTFYVQNYNVKVLCILHWSWHPCVFNDVLERDLDHIFSKQDRQFGTCGFEYCARPYKWTREQPSFSKCTVLQLGYNCQA